MTPGSSFTRANSPTLQRSNKVIDLGVWWRETTGLVLPLGGNAIRRSLGAEQHKIISKALARQHPACA